MDQQRRQPLRLGDLGAEQRQEHGLEHADAGRDGAIAIATAAASKAARTTG